MRICLLVPVLHVAHPDACGAAAPHPRRPPVGRPVRPGGHLVHQSACLHAFREIAWCCLMVPVLHQFRRLSCCYIPPATLAVMNACRASQEHGSRAGRLHSTIPAAVVTQQHCPWRAGGAVKRSEPAEGARLPGPLPGVPGPDGPPSAGALARTPKPCAMSMTPSLQWRVQPDLAFMHPRCQNQQIDPKSDA